MIKKILSTKELFIKTNELFKRDVIISKVNKNIITAILSLIVVVFAGAFSLNLLSSNSYIVSADNLSELPVTFVDGDFTITFDIDANGDGIATITETGEQGTHTFVHAGSLANLSYIGDPGEVPYSVTNGVLTINGSSLPIKSVVFTGNFAVENFNSMFKDFETLENVDFSGIKSIEEDDYTDMFTNCNNLKNIKLSDASGINWPVLNEANTDITLNFEDKEYTGKAITLDASDITVKCNGEELTYGRDFILTNYKNNTNVNLTEISSSKFTVKGVGNYTGSIDSTFTISKKVLDFETDFKFYRSDGTEITQENPLVKERDGSDSLPDIITIYYENPYNHGKYCLIFESYCYTTSKANNSSNIGIKFNGNCFVSAINEKTDNYDVTGITGSISNLGKIVDNIYPTFKNLTSSKATYGKGDTIILSLVMSEDIDCDSDVKLKLYSDDTYIGDAFFDDVDDNRITFKYDSDSIINDTITINKFVLDRTSGDITDIAGNKLDSSIATLQGSPFKIDTTGFSVTIETSEEDGTSKTDIPFKIYFGESLSNPNAEVVLEALDIVTNAKNSDVYENVKDITDAIEFTHITDGDYYNLIIHADKITKDTDTEGRYIKISIDKGKLTADNGTEKNAEGFKVLYINRVIPMDFTAYLYHTNHEDVFIKTFKSAEKIIPIYDGLTFEFKPNFEQGVQGVITAYKNVEDAEEHFTIVNNDENDGIFTYTFTSSLTAPTNFYDVYLKKNGFVNSPKVNFSFKWKDAQDVCDEFEESFNQLPKFDASPENFLNNIPLMQAISSFKTTFDVVNNLNNIRIISDSDDNVNLDVDRYLNDINLYGNYIVYRWINCLQDNDYEKITGDNVEKFIVQCMDEIDSLESFNSFLADYVDTDENCELARILYEKLSPFCKVLLGVFPQYKIRLDSILEKYEDVIKDDSTRLDLNNDGNFEVFGVVNYLDKENDEHSVLKVSKITDSNTLMNIDNKVKDICPQGESMIVPFDIKIVSSKDGNKKLEVKDSSKILVKMELPKMYLKGLIDIYHIKDDGNAEKITLLDKRLENKKCTILFEASDFSSYVLYGDPSVMISESGDMEGNSITPTLTKFTDNEDVTYEVTLAPNCKATLYAINSKGQKVQDNTIITNKGTSIFKLVKEKIASSYNDDSSIILYVKYEKVKEDNDPNNKGDIKPTTQTIISVQYLDHNSYMNGYSDNTFKPNDNITRAEIATILSRLSDTYSDMKNYSSYNASYSDITGDKWFNNYVGYITAKGIMNGYDGNFYPNKNMTRAEFSAAVVRYLNLISENANLNVSFTDVKGKWYEGDVMKLASLGYVNGYSDNTFKGDKPLTRAEACKILNLALNRNIKNKENVTDNYKLDVTRKFTDVSESAWYYLDVLEATIAHTSKEH